MTKILFTLTALILSVGHMAQAQDVVVSRAYTAAASKLLIQQASQIAAKDLSKSVFHVDAAGFRSKKQAARFILSSFDTTKIAITPNINYCRANIALCRTREEGRVSCTAGIPENKTVQCSDTEKFLNVMDFHVDASGKISEVKLSNIGLIRGE